MTAAQIVTPMGEEVATQPIRIALVGNPNCGKTAMFNALTGARQKVANYAGVTVERKEGRLTTEDGHTAIVLDLPGTYSLRARSPDEVVTRDAVLGRLEGETTPDVIVCVGYDMIEWPPSAWNPDGRSRIVCIDTVAPEIDAHYVPEVELKGPVFVTGHSQRPVVRVTSTKLDPASATTCAPTTSDCSGAAPGKFVV